MNLGKLEKFIVDRETKLGYVLTQDDSDIEYFLHHNECNGRVLRMNDVVTAFLYVDKKGRIAATLYKPVIEVNETGLLKVVAVNPELGIFLHNGISKDILMPKDELPKNVRIWPQEDDYYPCELKTKFNKLIMKATNKEKILEACKKEERLNKEDKVTAYVYRITPEGINVVTEDLEIIFIFKTNYREKVRLGQKVEVRIIDIHDNDYSGTMIENKEVQIVNDKEIIVEYLNKHNGVMLITEKSEPELINRLFNMSKGSFKKAIGGLLKENKIEILNDKIILIDYEV